MFNFLANETVSSVASDISSSADTSSSSGSSVLDVVLNWLAEHGVKLLIGIIFLLIFYWIVTFISSRILRRITKKKNIDPQVARTINKVVNVILKIIALLAFLGYVGIDTAGVGALISSFGVVIGLAVQGSLSNFAGGIVIVVMRPFKLGDFIEAQGYSGTVEEIHMFYTFINTPDNKVVMLPNGALSNDKIVNYSRNKLRRVDITYSISYDASLEKAKEVLKDVIEKEPLVLKNPEYSIKLSNMADSSLDITIKVWAKNENYWTVYFNLMENGKKALDDNHIEIPYNQLDVHVINKDK